MKVAVIGADGFIGRNLIKVLSKDYDVIAFDLAYKQNDFFKDNIIYKKGDFFRVSELETLVVECDVLFHSVCTINPNSSNEKYMYAYKNDFMQSIELCRLCTKYRKRLIFISSGGTVYGVQEKFPVSEDAALQPTNHYGNLKLCIENTLRVFAIQQNTDVLIARISNVYGPGQDYKKGVGFIDAVIKRGLSHETIDIYGDGNTVRDYVFVDDVCGMLLSLVEYKGKFNTFNISSGYGAAQNEILSIVSSYIPDLKFKYMAEREIDVKKIILDNSNIKNIYKGRIRSLNEGIKEYIDFLAGLGK